MGSSIDPCGTPQDKGAECDINHPTAAENLKVGKVTLKMKDNVDTGL